jgi:hypothetical protein
VRAVTVRQPRAHEGARVDVASDSSHAPVVLRLQRCQGCLKCARRRRMAIIRRQWRRPPWHARRSRRRRAACELGHRCGAELGPKAPAAERTVRTRPPELPRRRSLGHVQSAAMRAAHREELRTDTRSRWRWQREKASRAAHEGGLVTPQARAGPSPGRRLAFPTLQHEERSGASSTEWSWPAFNQRFGADGAAEIHTAAPTRAQNTGNIKCQCQHAALTTRALSAPTRSGRGTLPCAP